MYCTVQDMKNILPPSMSIGDQNIGTPTPGRPQTIKDSLTPEIARTYIGYAQQYIDARLRHYYLCPLKRVKSREWDVLQGINRGVHVPVIIYDATTLVTGEVVRLQGKRDVEECTIESISGPQSIVLASVTYNYGENGTTLSILEFPDPIPMICARFALSFMIDKLFVAEQSPDVSEYGKVQRNLARNDFEDILSGVTMLYGQEFTGKRFVRMPLLDGWATPAVKFDRNQEAES